MKSLRKSIASKQDPSRPAISPPVLLPALSKPPSATQPPQKVIRALSAYKPQAPQQLPFQKGDFFYVTGPGDDDSLWYEAHNPVTGARGLVPKSLFEEFCKSPAPIRTSYINMGRKSPSNHSPRSPKMSSNSAKALPRTQVFYAVVLHDFVAERADELDAKAGDPISVVAQSNREWFVAKPIGRLGRPGLIPVTFVEVRDPVTNTPIPDVGALMDRGELPKVEDWKRAMFNYKQSSIPLGVIDTPISRSSNGGSNPPRPHLQKPPPLPAQDQLRDPQSPQSPISLPDGILLSADVVSFHFENDDYWFRIHAIFQPYDPHDPHTLPKAKQLVLYRVYNDFYDFQVSLLENFPREAGRVSGSQRILPYMPGPADKVNDKVTASRQRELDEYLHQLCRLSAQGARYILEHRVVRQFIASKPGDVDNDIEPRYGEFEALLANQEESSGPDDRTPTVDAAQEEVQDMINELSLQDQEQDYEEPYQYDDGPTQSPRASSSSLHRPETRTHTRTDSASSLRRADSPHHRNAYSPYPTLSNADSSLSAHRSKSPHNQMPISEVDRGSTYSRTSATSNSRWPDHNASSPSSFHSSQPSLMTSSRSRSQSTATSNANTPPISAANPQTAFVKIKIFDRVTDDLIAIRVHPKVTHVELMEKVQSRLGDSILNLRFRDSYKNELVSIADDYELRDWLESTEKHVLYAD